MPFIVNTQNEMIRAANTALATAFFPRVKTQMLPRIASQYISTSMVEPFAILGSAPALSQFRGSLKISALPSFTMSVPNTLHKNGLEIKQSAVEGDQTGTIIRVAEQLGLRLSEYWDLIGCKRIISGSTVGDAAKATAATSGIYAPAGSVTCKGDDGTAYNMVIDALPFFSASHTFDGGVTTQSNNLASASGMPATIAGIQAQSVAVTAVQMATDMQYIMSQIRTIKDSAGVPMYPTIDAKKDLKVIVPPILEPAARLAFMIADTGMLNMSSPIMQTFVNEVISHGYLAGLPDPERDLIATAPLNPTDWYVAISNDYVRPLYMQTFRPKKGSELAPPGYDVEGEVARILALDSSITVPQATLWASTRIDSTFNRVGADADAWTIQNDAFMASARFRGNIAYGFWPTMYRIYPANGQG